jgi:hypothetical protein
MLFVLIFIYSLFPFLCFSIFLLSFLFLLIGFLFLFIFHFFSTFVFVSIFLARTSFISSLPNFLETKSCTISRIELAKSVGISTEAAIDLLAKESGGMENLGFTRCEEWIIYKRMSDRLAKESGGAADSGSADGGVAEGGSVDGGTTDGRRRYEDGGTTGRRMAAWRGGTWNCGSCKSLQSAKCRMGRTVDKVRTTSVSALCGPRM